MSISIKQLRQSFVHALQGIGYVFRHEQNFRIEILIAIGVVLLALWFEVRQYEFIVLLLLIFAVLTLELVNSSLEKFFDVVHPRLKDHVKVAKDIMAGAVLFSVLCAVVVGVVVFSPYISDYLGLS